MFGRVMCWTIFLTTIFFGACSTSSKNRFVSGELTIEEIKLNRYSWFQEMSLVAEIFVKKVGKEDLIRKLFSTKELEVVDSCSNFFVMLAYSQDSNKITYKMLRDRLEKISYAEVVIPDFKNNFKLHPDYESYAFRLYSVVGFCGSGPEQFDMTFSSFPDSIIHI